MKLLESAQIGAKENFAKFGNTVPVCLILGKFDPKTQTAYPEDQLLIVKLDFHSDIAKQKSFYAIRQIVVDTKATELALVAEAWMVRKKAEPLDCNIDPATHPDNMECVHILYETPISSRMFFAEVLRPEGAAPTLGAWEEIPEGQELTKEGSNFFVAEAKA